MSFWNIFTGPVVQGITTLLSPITDHFKHKREMKTLARTAEIKVRTQQLNRIDADANADNQWNLQSIKNADTSWKDEYILLLWSVPIVLCFLGAWGAGIVTAGFVALSTTPAWYQAAWGIMIASAFGIKKFSNYMMGKLDVEMKNKNGEGS